VGNQIEGIAVRGAILFGVLLGVNSLSAQVDATFKTSKCEVKVRQGKKWKAHSTIVQGTRVTGNKKDGFFVFRSPRNPEIIAVAPLDCLLVANQSLRYEVKKAKKIERAHVPLKFSVFFAPAYLGTSFSLVPASGSGTTYNINGKVIGGSVGLGLIKTYGSVQLGISAVFGAGTGFASYSEGGTEYTARFTRGFFMMVPLDVYYAFGSSSIGVGAGLKYLKLDWPGIETPELDSTPDSVTGYMVDIGYRLMTSGFFLNPRFGWAGASNLFGTVFVGFSF
jgi:hypothetical protein